MIQCVFLGTKDYVKDCWHDYIMIPRWQRQEKAEDGWILGKFVTWKEGSVWHYIKQRRVSRFRKRTNLNKN